MNTGDPGAENTNPNSGSNGMQTPPDGPALAVEQSRSTSPMSAAQTAPNGEEAQELPLPVAPSEFSSFEEKYGSDFVDWDKWDEADDDDESAEFDSDDWDDVEDEDDDDDHFLDIEDPDDLFEDEDEEDDSVASSIPGQNVSRVPDSSPTSEAPAPAQAVAPSGGIVRYPVVDLPDNIKNPPIKNRHYQMLRKHVTSNMKPYWPNGVTITKICTDLASTAGKRMRKRKSWLGYTTWADILRSMPDVVRIEGALSVGYTVYLVKEPKRKKASPVIDPENPPWWYTAPGPKYIPPGPRRKRRGLKEYEAFRNIVRNLLKKYPAGISLPLFCACQGLSGKKAKKMRLKTGFSRLVDMLRSMPDLIDFIEAPDVTGGYIVKAHDPSEPLPPPPPDGRAKAPPGAPVLPAGSAPKIEQYQAFRDCVIWNWDNTFMPSKYPHGVALEVFCSGYGITGPKAKRLRVNLGYNKAQDLIRSMPDLATILEDPQEEGAWIVKRTDPATVPPDYNPIPRRFPSDPRISRANPLGSPFLPKGTMTRKQMFAAFREGGWMVYPAAPTNHPDELKGLPPLVDRSRDLTPVTVPSSGPNALPDPEELDDKQLLSWKGGEQGQAKTKSDFTGVTPQPKPAELPPIQAIPQTLYEFEVTRDLAKRGLIKEPTLLRPVGRLQKLKLMVINGVRKLGEDFPDGIPILYFVSQTALSTRPAIAIRKKLGYRKAADLLIDMPEYLTVVRDPFTPGDFKLFPSPRLVEEIKQADAEAAEKEEKKKEREEAAMKEWEELRKKDEEWAKGGFLLEGEDLEDLEEKGSVEISPSEKELGAETSEEGSQELRLVEEQGPEKLQEEEGEEEGEVQQEEEEGGPPRKRYVRKKGHKERFKVDKNAMEYGTEKSIGGTDITLEDLLKKWEKEEPPEEPKTRWYEKEELDPMDMLKATGMQMDDEADSAWAASTQKKPAAEAAQEEEVVVEDVLELDDDWEVVEGVDAKEDESQVAGHDDTLSTPAMDSDQGAVQDSGRFQIRKSRGQAAWQTANAQGKAWGAQRWQGGKGAAGKGGVQRGQNEAQAWGQGREGGDWGGKGRAGQWAPGAGGSAVGRGKGKGRGQRAAQEWAGPGGARAAAAWDAWPGQWDGQGGWAAQGQGWGEKWDGYGGGEWEGWGRGGQGQRYRGAGGGQGQAYRGAGGGRGGSWGPDNSSADNGRWAEGGQRWWEDDPAASRGQVPAARIDRGRAGGGGGALGPARPGPDWASPADVPVPSGGDPLGTQAKGSGDAAPLPSGPPGPSDTRLQCTCPCHTAAPAPGRCRLTHAPLSRGPGAVSQAHATAGCIVS